MRLVHSTHKKENTGKNTHKKRKTPVKYTRFQHKINISSIKTRDHHQSAFKDFNDKN